MALQRTPLAIQFASGVDTKTDQKQVAITKLIDLQNAVFTKSTTLSKRNGYRSLGRSVDSQNANYANPMGIAKRQDELILFADAQAYSYRSTSDSWSDTGDVSSVVASASPIARTGTVQTYQDLAINNGIEVVAWMDNRGGVWCSVVEQASQRILAGPIQLDPTGNYPRVVPCGNTLQVIWLNSTGTELWLVVINTTLPETIPPKIQLATDITGNYDVCATSPSAFPGIQPALIAWCTSTGYNIGYVHPSGVMGSPVTGLPALGIIVPSVPPEWICCSFCLPASPTYGVFAAGIGTDGTAYYSFHNTNSLSSIGATDDLWAGVGAGLMVTAEFSSATNVWWAVQAQGSDTQETVQTGSVDLTGGVANSTTIMGHVLSSRAFLDGSDVYCAIGYPVLYFPYIAIVQVSANMRAQARLLPGQASVTRQPQILPGVSWINGVSGRQHLLGLGYRIQLAGSSGTQFGEQGIQAFTLDFDHDDAYRTAELGLGVYLSGALIQHYDGLRWAEADFHTAPDTTSGTITAVPSTGSGSLTSSVSYLYKFIYEEIDAQGELHQGAVSVGTLVAMAAGNNTVTIAIPTYRLTSKLRVRIGVFRSTGNATGDPEAIEYFRVSSVLPNVSGPNGYVLNDPTVDSVTFVDEMSDATAETLEPLYTNGGVLSNDPVASGGEIIAGGKYRLFWTDPLDGSLVNYSKQLSSTDVAMESSPFLNQRLDPFGGDIVALAVMDDNVIVFRQTAIYAFGGPGPDADGGLTTSDAFTPPQLVTSDVGCKSRSSVCQSPVGIMFQSDKGIYLLGRDLSVRRIGDPVFAYNAQTITRSTLLPDRPHVIFLTNSGRTLLYDYDRDQWSTFTNHEGLDAIVVNGQYYYLRTDGRVFAETIGIYQDGEDRHIPILIETAWIKFADYLQGWQRVLHALFLGTYVSSHLLRVRFRLDYEPAYFKFNDVAVDGVYSPRNYGDGTYGSGTYGGVAGVSSMTYQQSFHINKRCQAISFRIEDFETAENFGASFELSELLLIGGVLGPKFRVGATRQN